MPIVNPALAWTTEILSLLVVATGGARLLMLRLRCFEAVSLAGAAPPVEPVDG